MARAAHLGPERRRPLVLDAALRVFLQRGYTGSTMTAIAEAAEVTKPVVYECYPNKEELFYALLDREERKLVAAAQAAVPHDLDTRDFEGMLHGGVTSLLAAADAEPDAWRVVYDVRVGTTPAIVERVQRGRAQVLSTLERLVALDLKERGAGDVARLSKLYTELLASVVESAIRVLISQDRDNPEWTCEELAGRVTRFVMRGIDGR